MTFFSLDSCLRRNDEEEWIPASAGTSLDPCFRRDDIFLPWIPVSAGMTGAGFLLLAYAGTSLDSNLQRNDVFLPWILATHSRKHSLSGDDA